MNTEHDLFAPRRPANERGSLPMSWHDSTWDLRRGLEIVEDVPAHLLPHEWQKALFRAPCGLE